MADLSQYDPVIETAAKEWGLDPNLLRALILQESGGQTGQTSKAGAQGLTQIMPETAKTLGVTNLNDPAQQIFGAAKYLAQGYAKEGSPEGALLYYHGGPGWRQAYGSESAGYVPGVAGHYATLNKGASQPQPNVPSDDDFLKQTGGIPAAAPAASAPNVPSDDDFLKQTGGVPQAPAAAPVAPTYTPSQLGQTGNWVTDAMVRGAHQALDVPSEALASGADWVANKLGYQGNLAAPVVARDQAAAADYAANPANQGWEPAGFRIGTNILATLPVAASAGGLAGGVARIGTNVLSAGSPYIASALSTVPAIATGAGAGGAVAAQTGQPIGQGALEGAALGGGLGMLGNTANALMRTSDPAILNAVEGHGIPLRAGQVSSNKLVRYLDDMTAPESSNAKQRAAFNTDAASAMGITPDVAKGAGLPVGKITPQVMAFARNRLGSGLNAIEHKVVADPNGDFLNALSNIDAAAAKTPSAYGDIRPHIEDVLDTAIANNGTLPGGQIAKLIGHGSPLDAAIHSDNGTVRQYATQIKDTLQDLMQSNMSPEDAAAYGKLRYQYKNMMTLAPLVNKGVPGDINPVLLQSAANRSFKNNAFQGSGDLGELGDIGQMYLKGMPQSGTEPREMLRGALYGDIRRILGVGASLSAKPAIQSVLGANPLTGPFVGNSLRYTIPAEQLLRNQLLTGPLSQ